EQTYERRPDRDGLAAWRYSDPQHGAFELTVDDGGLVVDYAGFARRVRPRAHRWSRPGVGCPWEGPTMEHLDYAAIRTAGLADWRPLAQGLYARYRVADAAATVSFAGAAVEAAGPHADHLELTLGGGAVMLRAATRHDNRLWVTAADVELARAVTAVAREGGAVAEPHLVAQLELGLDTWSVPAQSRFWAALLTGDPERHGGGDVVDLPPGLPAVWFQETDAHETPRQRWHLDLWLDPSVAPGRVAAAVAAGGMLVDDSEAPSFTVVADPEGNRVCVCTTLDRGSSAGQQPSSSSEPQSS
ncbi:MAG: putative glycolipid-binding domain-containing protein, partial [Phycicoccus sp.]